MGETSRGICAVCDGDFALLVNGGIRYHTNPEGPRDFPGRAKMCAGVHQPVKIVLPSASLAAAEERGRAEGRQWAIDTLRDYPAYAEWLAAQPLFVRMGGHTATSYAEYLEAVAPGGTDA